MTEVKIGQENLNIEKRPLVSIIMNCYNSSKFLKEAIESVLIQTYSNWEIVFWDNQSVDSSAEIFKSYKDKRFRYFYAENHTPLSEARNLAINKANGYWLAFLDCDDLWLPEKLMKQIEVAGINPEIGLVYSPFNLIVETTQKNNSLLYYLTHKLICKPHGPENIYKLLLESNFIIFSGVLLKKSLFEKTGGFSNSLVHNEDYQILLKVCLNSLAVCIDKRLVSYRIHDSNATYLNDEIKFRETIEILDQLPDSKFVRKAASRNYIRYSIFKIRYGNTKEGLTLLLKNGTLSGLLEIIMRRIKFLDYI